METCAEALDVIRRRTAKSCRDLDDSAIEFAIEHVVRVELRIVDDRQLGLRAPLHDFVARVDRGVMTQLLKGNAYGQSTGAARLALDPTDNRPILLMSLAVEGQDEASLIEQTIEFANHAAYWQTIGSDELESLREHARVPLPADDRWDDVVLVRV